MFRHSRRSCRHFSNQARGFADPFKNFVLRPMFDEATKSQKPLNLSNVPKLDIGSLTEDEQKHLQKSTIELDKAVKQLQEFSDQGRRQVLKQLEHDPYIAKYWKTIYKEFNDQKEQDQIRQFLFEKERKIRAAIFDFSGTTWDQCNELTIRALALVFAHHNIIVSIQDLLHGIGQDKAEHIFGVMNLPHIAAKYKPCRELARQMGHVDFPKMVAKIIQTGNNLILPYTENIFDYCIKQGIYVGVTTGFPRAIADMVLQNMNLHPVIADNLSIVASNDPGIEKSRPYGDMIRALWNIFGIHPWYHMGQYTLKVGDTPEDIGEGKSVYAWTAAVAEDSALNIQHRNVSKVINELLPHQPDYIIRNISLVPRVIADINRRLKMGQRPNADNVFGENRTNVMT